MKRRLFWGLFLILYITIAVITLLRFNGTADQGDSVMHYFYALHAPQHPALFFDLWAKPIFVALACPFAQFGFIGMKIFNLLLVLSTIWFTWRTAIKLKMPQDWAVPVFMLFTPLYYILTYSGLTEPLFAFFVSLILFFAVSDKNRTASILVSLLPFVRSEGLIILGVFALYLMIKRDWKYLLWLPAGHIFFMIAGSFVYHDILWVFTHNPYARLSSTYGSGGIHHFVIKMLYVTGVPLYGLFIAGFLKTAWLAIRRKQQSAMTILVFLGFSAYFTAHSLFFYFGIFNSMGLHRVLIGVMPFIALIALSGFNLLTTDFIRHRKVVVTVSAILLALVVVFPFVKNPAAIHWEKDMNLGFDQMVAAEISDELCKSDQPDRCYLYSYVYFSETLNIDPFDSTRHKDISHHNIQSMKPGDILLWDSWFSVVESGMPYEEIDTMPGLTKIMSRQNKKNDAVLFSVYQKK